MSSSMALSKTLRRYLVMKVEDDVSSRKSREIEGAIKNATVSKKGEHWYVSVQTEQDVQKSYYPSRSAVGIDLGVKQFATLSTGRVYESKNSFKQKMVRLAKLQQRLSKKKRGSSNSKKLKKRINRLHTKIANIRNDYLHQVSTHISKSHALVVLEDLKVSNMSKSASGTMENPGKNVAAKSGLNRSILDQGWHNFKSHLSYKLDVNTVGNEHERDARRVQAFDNGDIMF